MASNPFNLPENQKEVVDRAKTDVKSQLPGSDPFIKNSYIGALITGYGGRIYDLYQQLRVLIKQIFPQTATGEYLERWGFLKKIMKNAASQSSGTVFATGLNGSVIPINSQMNSSNGNLYTVDDNYAVSNIVQIINSITRSGSTVIVTTASSHNLATGIDVTISGANQTDYNGTHNIIVVNDTVFTYDIPTTPATPATGSLQLNVLGVQVSVKSVGYGSTQNLSSGSTLSFTNPIAGIDSDAYVTNDQIGGGTDVETDEEYRVRVIEAYQNPVSFFNTPQLIQQAKKVAGVTRVFVREITPNVGQVTIYFTRDNDTDSIIPSTSEVNTVKEKLLEIKPSHVAPADVIVLAPTAKVVNFTFTSISPDTPSMRSSITENLKAFFQEETDVGATLYAYQYNSVIFRTIDLQTGLPLNSFVLSAPTGDITTTSSEIAILGTVTF